MRVRPCQLFALLLTACAESATTPRLTPELPTVVEVDFRFIPNSPMLGFFLAAAYPDGPLTTTCHGEGMGLELSVSGRDSVGANWPLPVSTRTQQIHATMECEIRADSVSLTYPVSLDLPAGTDEPPVIDSTRFTLYSDSSFGMVYWVSDDWHTASLRAEVSVEPTCPCVPLIGAISTPRDGLVFGAFPRGNRYIRFILTDDAGQETILWRGPFTPPP